MPSITIICSSCKKKNRIPSDKVGQKARCGSCGQILTDIDKNQTFCKLCHKLVSDGIHLSDGGMIHESCLKSIQDKNEQTKSKIITKQHELEKLRGEIKRRKGIMFKITSIFLTPDVDDDNIEKSIIMAEKNIKQLTNRLESLRNIVALIYDYFLSYPPDWNDRKNEVIKRDGNQCDKCGSWIYLHLHHIKPLSKGGSNKISNLKLLCEDCHSKTHGGKDFSGEFSSLETAFSKRVANIRYAIKNNKQIKFSYKKPSDTSYIMRTVKPAKLINVDHYKDSESTLCVQGYCELRKANRVFALKRMRGLNVISA